VSVVCGTVPTAAPSAPPCRCHIILTQLQHLAGHDLALLVVCFLCCMARWLRQGITWLPKHFQCYPCIASFATAHPFASPPCRCHIILTQLQHQAGLAEAGQLTGPEVHPDLACFAGKTGPSYGSMSALARQVSSLHR
jgi:hypothetical protein